MASITSCAKCGKVIEESPSISEEERTPCPKCGSIARAFLITPESGTMMFFGMDAILEKAEIPIGALLLQTVIVPGEKTTEGQLIEAVALPWLEIITYVGRDPAAVHQIPSRTWEEIIAGAYKAAGFDRVTLTPRSGDLGRDVIAEKVGLGIVRVIDQVKAYRPGHLVTADEVRALMGVLAWEHASKGFLSTTSDFAPKIREDPVFTQFHPSQLELINGEMLLRRLTELARKST